MQLVCTALIPEPLDNNKLDCILLLQYFVLHTFEYSSMNILPTDYTISQRVKSFLHPSQQMINYNNHPVFPSE